MLDTIEKCEYRAKANIPGAAEYLQKRLSDRILLPLEGIHGEKIYLTGVSELIQKSKALDLMYQNTPKRNGVQDIILLDSHSSATIEGARTTVAQVKKSIGNPKTKDDRMVLNTWNASDFAYRNKISSKNIRHLWNIVVEDVCENEKCKGELYRDDMVTVGNQEKTIHTPARPEQLPELMNSMFTYLGSLKENYLIHSFVAHFYFVYIHPFCDGNGRTARILNSSQLYHNGYKKMKTICLSSAINEQLSGYYSSLDHSEKILTTNKERWIDISPFVSYMLDMFELSLIDVALSKNELNEREKKLLEKMNSKGLGAEITVKKAQKILNLSESTVRKTLNSLVDKGYLTLNKSSIPFIFRLEKNIEK